MQQDDSTLDQIRTWLQAAGAVAVVLWGWLPAMVQVLVVLQTCDIVSGVALAARYQSVASRKMQLAPKVAVLLIAGVAYYMDRTLHVAIAHAVCGWYCMKEGLSLVENAGRLGVPVPPGMRRAFEALRGEEKK